MAAQNFKLFLGCLGNGVTVCNSAVMENGDFKMVAHISNEGKITWYVGEDYPPADALASIRACAEQERAKYETWLNGLSPAALREYQLKRDIREYVNRVSDCHIVRDELDSFVELVKLPEKLSPLSKESVLEWFYMHRAYRDDLYDGMGCSGQFFTTSVKLFRRRGRWYAYHFVSVDM